MNVVNRISCFALFFFLEGIWGGIGHPAPPLATLLDILLEYRPSLSTLSYRSRDKR